MSIPKMAKAMGYIDDDLVSGAVEYKRTTKKNSWLKWGAMAACLFLVAVGVVRIGIGFIPSYVGDIYRQGVLVEVDTISNLPAEFNGRILVENMVLSDNVWIELYYSEEGTKSNPDDWYSLLISDITQNNEVLIHCMFGDTTVDDWKIDMVFTKDATIVKNINGVDIQIASLAPSASYEYWNYAIFEYDGVVYDVRVKSNDADDIYTVLNELLKN